MSNTIIPWPCLIDYSDDSDLEQNQSNKNQTKSNSKSKTTVSSKKSPIIPSNRLHESIPVHVSSGKDPKTNQQPQKTFAQAVSNLCDIPSSQLPQPVIMGDRISITIPEEEYEAGRHTCKYNLHARVIWPKGATPLSTFDLKAKISGILKNLSLWGCNFNS
jgi:hypothetical protein